MRNILIVTATLAALVTPATAADSMTRAQGALVANYLCASEGKPFPDEVVGLYMAMTASELGVGLDEAKTIITAGAVKNVIAIRDNGKTEAFCAVVKEAVSDVGT